jgi:hypothetical protein
MILCKDRRNYYECLGGASLFDTNNKEVARVSGLDDVLAFLEQRRGQTFYLYMKRWKEFPRECQQKPNLEGAVFVGPVKLSSSGGFDNDADESDWWYPPEASPKTSKNRFAGKLGWCHACCTFQMGEEARYLPMAWNDGKKEWACVNCDDEPWGLGVWDWFREEREIPNPDEDDGHGSTFTDGALKWLKARSEGKKT